MEKQRFLVALILIPIFIATNILGGIWFSTVVTLFVSIAAWEYSRLFRVRGARPADLLIVGSTVLLCVSHHFYEFQYDMYILLVTAMVAITWHLIQYEKGRDQGATDFAVTLSAIFYVGYLGSFMFWARHLTEGEWLIFTFFPSVWAGDTGAYMIGRKIGKHKMSPRLSPNKSWEGYISGVVFSVLITVLLVFLYQNIGMNPNTISLTDAVFIGLVMGVFPTLGDLGASMIKRQMGVKDSGKLLPGHGGVFDRIDSWLWMGVLSFLLLSTGLIG
ncbi:MAG: phosphatidate cytidylyltransferase [Anaerolineales bacterium]|nr:phosphatidate cytidylyltransferase [Anaerolineales bacterium]